MDKSSIFYGLAALFCIAGLLYEGFFIVAILTWIMARCFDKDEKHSSNYFER